MNGQKHLSRGGCVVNQNDTMNRRSFFTKLRNFAAVVALAPQIAFGTMSKRRTRLQWVITGVDRISRLKVISDSGSYDVDLRRCDYDSAYDYLVAARIRYGIT